jgi:Skp family chaperone for outer membrane proteins
MKRFEKLVLGASLVALLSVYLPVQAQPAPAKPPVSTRAQIDSLFTQQERDQFREKMRAAKTREERREIQKQMHGTMEQRAKEKGITLPQGRHGIHHGRPGGDANRPQLFTPEERQQYRDKMRSAKTPEERAEIQKQMRANMAQRAKEKGITLPQRGESRHGPDGHRPRLLTPEDRAQYRDRMRAAKTPEERAALRKQMHELAQQRAKEKGITLPERRRPSAPAPAEKSK